MHETNIPQCPILEQKCAHMCAHMLQNGASGEIGLVHYGSLATSLFIQHADPSTNQHTLQRLINHIFKCMIHKLHFIKNAKMFLDKQSTLVQVKPLFESMLIMIFDILCVPWIFNSLRPATHICVGKLINIASDNGSSPGRRQAIIRNIELC